MTISTAAVIELGEIDVMAHVQAIVSAAVRNSNPQVDAVVRHLPLLPGKGVRPQFSLLAAAAARMGARPPVEIAAGIELMHLGSLHHDDVVDASPHRRGKPTVAALWGNQAAAFAGTFLLARGTELIAAAGDAAAVAAANCTAEMWRGQTRELLSRFRLDRRREDYFEVTEGKTGALFGLAARLGALVAGAEIGVISACDKCGRLLGKAFQLKDDIADFTGDGRSLGKPVLSDVRSGNYSLPVILALESSGPPADRLRGLLGFSGLDDAQVVEVRDFVIASGAIVASRDAAYGLFEQAHSSLTPLPQGPALARLHNFIEEMADAA